MIRLELVRGRGPRQAAEFHGEEIRVGRSAQCAFVISEFHVSGEHAVLFHDGEAFRVYDNQSTNGTRILRSGEPLPVPREKAQARELKSGDVLDLGDEHASVQLAVRVEGEGDNARIVSVRGVAELEAVPSEATADRELLREIYRAQRAISGIHDVDELLDIVAQEVFRFVQKATHVTVALVDVEEQADKAGRYQPIGTRIRNSDSGGKSVPITRSVFRKVVQERTAVLAADAQTDVADTESLMAAQILSTIGIPLWIGDKIFGVLQVDNRDARGVFREQDLDRLSLLAQPTSQAFNTARLFAQLQQAEAKLRSENRFLKQERPHRFDGIVGKSAPMQALFDQLEKVVHTRVTVLVEGETGTGKELVARALHHWSDRRDNLFVAQNCAALPENLLESELFGHRRGAFTGAVEDKKGLFMLAHEGTLFLDEVAEMPLSLQAKLLRVLQESEVRPVGANETERVDVRIVAATHRDLELEVREGRFREDLLYRLRVFPVRVPPLRERIEDLPLLAEHFVEKYSQEFAVKRPSLSPELLTVLQGYEWPGNVRELENEVQRMMIQGGDETTLLPEHASERIRGGSKQATTVRAPRGTLKAMMETLEKGILNEALREHNNNKSATARSLGITREGLHKKLKNYGM